jgi:hypothetical protein
MKPECFGKWYRGRIDFTAGSWRAGLTQDFGTCMIGISFWKYAFQITLLFWSVDVAHLTRVDRL